MERKPIEVYRYFAKELAERFNVRLDEIDKKLDRIEDMLATIKKQEEKLK